MVQKERREEAGGKSGDRDEIVEHELDAMEQ
jgi:hypothetical protein